MDSYTLTLEVRREEGALPRLLGRVAQKGLTVRSVVARRSEDDERLEVRLTVEGAPPSLRAETLLEGAFGVTRATRETG